MVKSQKPLDNLQNKNINNQFLLYKHTNICIFLSIANLRGGTGVVVEPLEPVFFLKKNKKKNFIKV